MSQLKILFLYSLMSMTVFFLQAYLSVLYMRLPGNFCMLLRGRVVEYHNIATDLKYPEFILYKPHNGRCVEVVVQLIL